MQGRACKGGFAREERCVSQLCVPPRFPISAQELHPRAEHCRRVRFPGIADPEAALPRHLLDTS